ncbi:hypothetical protein C475_22364 [Halosimplex carlsbadense 2-9-1]|uniref:Uncharacterized protein n=1 Tax=Halosimplex carlsbadense 2-9-1 TaxID=797114 RepID=M0CCW6_9EURY|nr:hypothetical protein C475_22364 [Halosimplex carlsbadense 2-9-1]
MSFLTPPVRFLIAEMIPDVFLNDAPVDLSRVVIVNGEYYRDRLPHILLEVFNFNILVHSLHVGIKFCGRFELDEEMVALNILLVRIVSVVIREIDNEVESVIFLVPFDWIWTELSDELRFPNFVEFLIRTALRHIIGNT